MLASFFTDLPFYSTIEDLVFSQLDLDGYLDQLFTFLTDLDAITLLLGILVGGIIILIGTFELLKKLSKLIILVGILAGLYLLYSNGALDGLING